MKNLRHLIFDRFRNNAEPLIWFQNTLIPAASIWALSRIWKQHLEAAEVKKGAIIETEALPSPAFVSLILTCLHGGYWLKPVKVLGSKESKQGTLRMRLVGKGTEFTQYNLLTAEGLAPAFNDDASVMGPESGGLLLETSGSSGAPKTYGITPENIFSVIDSHAKICEGLESSISWSFLPLHHAFGLIIDLLIGLLHGRMVVFPSVSSNDFERVHKEIHQLRVNRICAVPGWMHQFLSHNPTVITQLQNGIIGGAPCSDSLAKKLKGSRIQSGYGLTEASPGVALGKPGEWEANLGGYPVGCKIKLDTDSQLLVKGSNTAAFHFSNNEFHKLDDQRWVKTGDIVSLSEDGCISVKGRTNTKFKLDNGYWVQPEEIEHAIKTQFSEIDDCIIFSRNGSTLELAVKTRNVSSPPNLQAVRNALKGLGARLSAIHAFDSGSWAATRKGDPERSMIRDKCPQKHAKE